MAIERIRAELEARLTVGHEATCSGCGLTVVRVVAGDSRLGFGDSVYRHPGYDRCPGRPADEGLRVGRGR